MKKLLVLILALSLVLNLFLVSGDTVEISAEGITIEAEAAMLEPDVYDPCTGPDCSLTPAPRPADSRFAAGSAASIFVAS